jgi:hypothetical protein
MPGIPGASVGRAREKAATCIFTINVEYGVSTFIRARQAALLFPGSLIRKREVL